MSSKKFITLKNNRYIQITSTVKKFHFPRELIWMRLTHFFFSLFLEFLPLINSTVRIQKKKKNTLLIYCISYFFWRFFTIYLFESDMHKLDKELNRTVSRFFVTFPAGSEPFRESAGCRILSLRGAEKRPCPTWQGAHCPPRSSTLVATPRPSDAYHKCSFSALGKCDMES